MSRGYVKSLYFCIWQEGKLAYNDMVIAVSVKRNLGLLQSISCRVMFACVHAHIAEYTIF